MTQRTCHYCDQPKDPNFMGADMVKEDGDVHPAEDENGQPLYICLVCALSQLSANMGQRQPPAKQKRKKKMPLA